MSVLPVVKYGNTILRKKVKFINPDMISDLRNLINNMFDTMYEEEGIGLAANQVGFDMNLMVIDVSHLDEYKNIEPMVFINTEILEEKGYIEIEEGCLSIPEIRASVKRAETVVVKFYDEEGNRKTQKFSGMLCRVILHELDHLNGKFFTDYLSPAKRKLVHNKLIEISKNGYPSTGVIL
ncbi:MAG: peptide deformylase [Candidatus Marinimicrobia bacterium]|nr:peptide deformylase [Candidatus Neomarinimicrobiota bacterium]|tara:strand:- start:2307 stop:2846 length:540 start_codon:yes stop_codon:yes gene_type:complete